MEYTIVDVPILFDRNNSENVAKLSHLEGKFKHVKELNCFYCAKCGESLSAKSAWEHYLECSYVDSGKRSYGKRELKKSFCSQSACFTACDYWCKKLPRITGFKVSEGFYTANKCIELGCYFCSTSKDQIKKHLGKVHQVNHDSYPVDVMVFAKEVKVHEIDPMRRRAFVFEINQSASTADEGPPTNTEGLDHLASLYDQVHVPNLHQDARKNSLFEINSHFDKIVPDGQREIAAFFGSTSSGTLIDPKLYATVDKAVHCYFKFIKHANKQIPGNLQGYLGKCLSKGKDDAFASSFRLTETHSNSYVLAAKMFILFLFALNGNIELPPCDDSSNNNDESVLDRIPAKWKSLVIPFKVVIDQLYQTLSTLSNMDSLSEMPLLDLDEGSDTELSHIPRPSESEKELAMSLLRMFEKILLRPIGIQNTNEDIIPIFLVCLSLETKDAYRKKDSITSYYAGLEHFLRSTALFVASKEIAIENPLTNEASAILSKRLCRWLDNVAVPNIEQNNVAYVISDKKQLCRCHLPNLFEVKVQMVPDSLGRVVQLVGRETTVGLDKVQQRLGETMHDIRAKMNRALGLVGLDFTEFDLSELNCKMGNLEAGYSFLQNEKLKALYKGGIPKLNSIMGTKDEKEFIWLCHEIPLDILGVVHVGVGMPSRSTSYLSIQLQNGGGRHERDVIIVNGGVIIIIRYEKRRNMLQEEYLAFKFLPWPLAMLLVNYLVYLRPLLTFALASKLPDNSPEQVTLITNCKNSLLLCRDGSLMSSDQILCKINAFLATIGKGNQALQVSHWRHVSEYWMRFLIAPSEAAQDFNRKYSNFAANLLDEGMHHSPLTGAFYGVALGESLSGTLKNETVSRQQLAVLRDVGILWQQLVGLVEVPNPPPSASLPAVAGLTGRRIAGCLASATKADKEPSIDTVNLHLTHNETVIVAEDHCFGREPLLDREEDMWELLSDARDSNLFGLGDNLFKSRSMLQLFCTMSASSASFVVRATTGLGKSSLFQYYAIKRNKTRHIVVVIIPMKALLIEQLETAKALGINAELYDPILDAQAKVQAMLENGIRILFAQMERIEGLGKVITTLSQNNWLGRVFLDECQIALENEYRKCAPMLNLLKELSVPKTFLTATLEVKHVQSALKKFGTLVGDKLELPRLLTAGTTRANLSICLEECSLSNYESFIGKKICDLSKEEPAAITMIFCHRKTGVCSLFEESRKLRSGGILSRGLKQ